MSSRRSGAARGSKRARLPDAPDFSSLPLEVIATHILKSDILPEPGDLRRLRAVSRRMRDAVAATGRKIRELSNLDAVELGNVSLLKDRHSRGLLYDFFGCRPSMPRDAYLCAAAARKGDLEELKALRADKWPWDEWTCAHAAYGGHLEVLKWARENDCPWDEWTCANAAKGGHLEVLKWARENGCPWDEKTREYAAWKGYV